MLSLYIITIYRSNDEIHAPISYKVFKVNTWNVRSNIVFGHGEERRCGSAVGLGLGWPGPWVPAALRVAPQGSAGGIVARPAES